MNTAAIAMSMAVFATSAVSGEVSPISINQTSQHSRLTEQWWQWAMAVPRQQSPVSDPSGARCGDGQTGSTWFLAGGFGSSKIRRKCTVPAGRSLFFPLINTVYYAARDAETFTCERAKSLAKLTNDTAIDLFAEVDGTPIGNLKAYRFASDRCFNIFSRVPRTQSAYNAYPSATDGYWLLLKPLSPGRHTLKFGGKYNHSSVDFGRMVQDIEYELLVE
ncbi:hypothetical protein [Piscinibacter gummiphilus]|uniref:Uncharacterized protein n=1 Tax=Piscinibacter gummiphilus TaxID=946333 RepID=A0ABZ0CVD1_9BURK|nr:hypothetical protein [Piscinibacter gummiphilus]WOB06930.1 hypothetical protein RXV79_18630 [Piscinibacter gummiphilus]